MNQFLEASLQPINLPYTVLMATVMVYWVTVIMGLLDFSTFDVNIDVDVDMDVDVDVDGDIHAEGGAGSMLTGILHFFNIGTVPFMIVFSFLMIFMWAASVLTNHYFNNSSWLIALACFPVFLVGGLFFAKFASAPFVKVFEAMYNESDIKVIGKTCTLLETADSNHIAHAKITGSDGMVQTVNVKTTDGKVIPKGSQALVITYDESQKCYIIDEV